MIDEGEKRRDSEIIGSIPRMDFLTLFLTRTKLNASQVTL